MVQLSEDKDILVEKRENLRKELCEEVKSFVKLRQDIIDYKSKIQQKLREREKINQEINKQRKVINNQV